MTYGRLKVVCAISIVPNPMEAPPPISVTTPTNNSIIETPVTISGFIIGIFETVSIVF